MPPPPTPSSHRPFPIYRRPPHWLRALLQMLKWFAWGLLGVALLIGASALGSLIGWGIAELIDALGFLGLIGLLACFAALAVVYRIAWDQTR